MTAEAGLGLRHLILVMREDEVVASRVDVKTFSKYGAETELAKSKLDP